MRMPLWKSSPDCVDLKLLEEPGENGSGADMAVASFNLYLGHAVTWLQSAFLLDFLLSTGIV